MFWNSIFPISFMTEKVVFFKKKLTNIQHKEKNHLLQSLGYESGF